MYFKLILLNWKFREGFGTYFDAYRSDTTVPRNRFRFSQRHILLHPCQCGDGKVWSENFRPDWYSNPAPPVSDCCFGVLNHSATEVGIWWIRVPRYFDFCSHWKYLWDMWCSFVIVDIWKTCFLFYNTWKSWFKSSPSSNPCSRTFLDCWKNYCIWFGSRSPIDQSQRENLLTNISQQP